MNPTVTPLPPPSKTDATCPWCRRGFATIVELFDHLDHGHLVDQFSCGIGEAMYHYSEQLFWAVADEKRRQLTRIGRRRRQTSTPATRRRVWWGPRGD